MWNILLYNNEKTNCAKLCKKIFYWYELLLCLCWSSLLLESLWTCASQIGLIFMWHFMSYMLCVWKLIFISLISLLLGNVLIFMSCCCASCVRHLNCPNWMQLSKHHWHLMLQQPRGFLFFWQKLGHDVQKQCRNKTNLEQNKLQSLFLIC